MSEWKWGQNLCQPEVITLPRECMEEQGSQTDMAIINNFIMHVANVDKVKLHLSCQCPHKSFSFLLMRLKAWQLLENKIVTALNVTSRAVCLISFPVLLDTSIVDSPVAQPSPSQSSSQPKQQTQQIDSWWHTPRAWARGQWWCSTWRKCCVSPTTGESQRRGHGVYSRCCWLVQKLQRRQRTEVRK